MCIDTTVCMQLYIWKKTLKYYLFIFIFHFIEVLTPLILETQKQFNFTHIITGAGAFGKVK